MVPTQPPPAYWAMSIPIPRTCPVIVIEGIPGAGKTSLQDVLQRATRDRPVHAYPEEALLFHWSHVWIPGIHALRLQLMQRMVEHIEVELEAAPDALFLLTRFHLSYVLLGGDADDREYLHVVERLAAMGAQAWVPIVPESMIAARVAHPERTDPRWQAHLRRRLAQAGHADIAEMYREYQEAMLDRLGAQALDYRLLAPQSWP